VTSRIAHRDPIRRPPESSTLDYEAELAVVTPDAVPPGAGRVRIQGRSNGRVMQDANTDQLIFGVSALVEMISVAMSLEPSDVSITGTPGSVGAARKPPVSCSSRERPRQV
jgi:2-keto-4-pentenoate hydratase/2-oxohepta-3-ene-1,7-dioic acid hydratase in catechol pathway